MNVIMMLQLLLIMTILPSSLPQYDDVFNSVELPTGLFVLTIFIHHNHGTSKSA